MSTRFSEDREVLITVAERQQFLLELKSAMEARDGGSNDEEIAALWECVGSACGVFEVYEEDALYEESEDDLPILEHRSPEAVS